MRIVSAAEAVAGIESGQQIYLQCAAATPSVLLDALVARAPGTAGRQRRPPPHRGTRTAPRARRWPRTSDTGRCSSGRTPGAAVNEGRADYVPVFLSDVPRLFDRGLLPLDAVFVNATPPDAHGFCSLGTSVEAMHAAIRAAEDRHRPVQPRRCRARSARASSTSRRSTSRSRCDVPPYAYAPDDDRRGRATDRRVRRRARPRRRDAPARDRCDPGRHGARPARQARPGHPHRDVHRCRRRPRRGRASSPAPARSATAARSSRRS